MSFSWLTFAYISVKFPTSFPSFKIHYRWNYCVEYRVHRRFYRCTRGTRHEDFCLIYPTPPSPRLTTHFMSRTFLVTPLGVWMLILSTGPRPVSVTCPSPPIGHLINSQIKLKSRSVFCPHSFLFFYLSVRLIFYLKSFNFPFLWPFL